MAGRFVRGLATGLAVGVCAAAAASLVSAPQVTDATEAPLQPRVERTYGPPQSDLPRLRSDGAPPRTATPTGDE